jgi:hypothetical protein
MTRPPAQQNPAAVKRRSAASRAFAAAMRPFSAGASCLNFTVEDGRVRDTGGDDKYPRLAALKDAYDRPTGPGSTRTSRLASPQASVGLARDEPYRAHGCLTRTARV